MVVALHLAIYSVAGPKAASAQVTARDPASLALAQAVGDAPGEALFNYKISTVLRTNVNAFKQAQEEAWRSLAPGETKRYWVMMEKGPDGEPLKFISLAPVDGKSVIDAKLLRRGPVSVTKDRFAAVAPRVPLDKAAFDKIVAGLRSAKPRITYEDYVFSVQAHNHMLGLNQTFPFDKVAKGDFVWPESVVADLLDPTARAAASGTVILVADETSKDYSAVDADTGKVSKQDKGQEITKAGNTVWLLARPMPGVEYTVAYRNLKSIAVKAGDKVEPAQIVGELKGDGSAESTIEIWRVRGPAQRFLRGRDKPDGPYFVPGL